MSLTSNSPVVKAAVALPAWAAWGLSRLYHYSPYSFTYMGHSLHEVLSVRAVVSQAAK